ncbi:MAG: hypothetical protein WAM69_10075 [Candidatus Sulfotelmatobacter sp.]
MKREFTKPTDSKSEGCCSCGADVVEDVHGRDRKIAQIKQDAAEPALTADEKPVEADRPETKHLSEEKQQDEDARREAKIRQKLTRDWTSEERCFIFGLARSRETNG